MLLSIDPGVNNLGASISEYKDKVFYVHDSINICNMRRFTPEEKELEKKYDQRVVKVQAIINGIENFITNYNVTDAVFETAFYYKLRPAAYGSLIEVTSALKYTLLVPKGITCGYLEPTKIKALFTQEGFAAKEQMRNILEINISQGHIVLDKKLSLQELTEHQVDSIAIGFCFIRLREHNLI